MQNPSRKLTPEQVLEIRSSTLSSQVLADRYGVSRSAVHRTRHGIVYKDCPWPDEPVQPSSNRRLSPRQVLNIRSSSLSNLELAKKYKLPRSSIGRIRQGYAYKDCKWPKVEPQRYAQGGTTTRSLTEEQVRQIRRDALTEKYKELAIRFNVHPTTISNIMRGRTYTCVK